MPPKSEAGGEVGGSLAMVVAVLRASRYLFAYNGLLFVVFQSIAIRRAGQTVSAESIVEIAMLGLLGPAIVWVSTKWGERLAHHLEGLHGDLVTANQTAQQEITKRKQIDQALSEMDGQYRVMVEHANDFIVLLQNGATVYRNPALAELIGYTADETRDRNFLDFVAPEDHAVVRENYRRRLADEAVPDTYEVTLIGRRGERVTVEVTPSVIEHRGFPATMVVMHDITQRKAAEAALRESEHRMANILDISADAIISVGEGQRVFAFNRGAEEIFGYTADEVVGQPLDMLLPTTLANIHRQHVLSFSASPATARSMNAREAGIKGRRKDGSEFPAEASISKTLSGDDWIHTVYLRDITEQQGAQTAMEQSKEALQLFATHQAVLADIGRVITSSLQLEEVYDSLVERVRWLLQSDRVVISIIQPGSSSMTNAYVAGVDLPGLGRGHSTTSDDSVAWEAVRKKSYVLVQSDAEEEIERDYPTLRLGFEAGIRSFLMVPLISKDAPVGVLHLGSTRVNAYGERELALAESVAAQIAGTIANTELYNTVQRHALEQEVIGEIGRIISSSLNVEDVYDRFAQEVRKLISLDRITINLVDEENDEFRIVYSAGLQVPGAETGAAIPLQGSSTARVVASRSGLLLNLEDIVKSGGPPPDVAMFKGGIRSLLRAPLLTRGAAFGTLAISSTQSNVYDDRHLLLAERVAAQIAGAVANTRLYATVQRDAVEKEVLAEVGRIIGSTLNIEEVYERFSEQVRKLIPFERIGIFTIDLEKGELKAAYLVGFHVQARRRGTVIPLAGTVSEEIARTRSGLLIQPQDRAELTARLPSLLPLFDAGIRSFLTVPLISRNEVIGSLVLRSTDSNRYSERDLALAERIGAQIADAIANSRLYAEQERAEEALKKAAAELERNNEELAYEVAERTRAESALIQYSHDLAQSNGELEQFAYVASHDLQEPLRMVSSYTQLLARRYRGQLDSDAEEFISFAVDGVQRMQKLIEDLLEYSRVGSRGDAPEPTNLEEVLDEALTNLTAAIEESGAEVTRDPLPPLSVDASQLTQLFQNLIGNALKFRREAPQVHISAVTKEDLVTVSVRDNGIGIQSDYIERVFAIFQRLHTRDEYAGTGIGLAVCRRIVERHNGRIWAESEPGVGTTFYFAIPTNGHAEKRQRDEVGE